MREKKKKNQTEYSRASETCGAVSRSQILLKLQKKRLGQKYIEKIMANGTSLVVQQLRLSTPTARGHKYDP